ncbi:MAG: SurA N-terminal domain-containing protein [Bacteroidetes bacterium]|nr:SurA N-terminal domain-containing protein [Bacteroidota bacterium]
MAVIGSIRKRGTLLLVVIGLSMVAFILGEFLPRIFSESSDTGIASINGKEIHVNSFTDLYSGVVLDWQYANPDEEMTEDVRNQLSGQTWKKLLDSLVFYKEYKEAGLRVTVAELEDMLTGRTVHPLIQQYFPDPTTQQFSPDAVRRFANQFANVPADMEPDQAKSFYQAQTQWAQLQEGIKDERLSSKYFNLVRNAVYAPKKLVENFYHQSADMYSGAFAMLSYFSVPDSSYEPTESELKTYFSKNSFKFKRNPGWRIQYAVFEAIPTSSDSLALKNELLGLLDEFKITTTDSLFVMSNSEDKDSEPAYFKENTLPAALDSILFNAVSGSIVGPVISNGQFIIAKKMEDKFEPDSLFLHHIFFQPTTEAEVETKKAKRDSVLKLLEAGADFFALAAQFSDIPSAAEDSGKLNWITRAMPEQAAFLDSAFKTTSRSFIAANSTGGYHILKQTRYTKPKKQVLIAQIVRTIEPSKKTRDDAFTKASEFSSKAVAKGEKAKSFFDESRMSGQIRIEYDMLKAASRRLRSITESSEIVRWALGAEVGIVSQVFTSNNTFMVGYLEQKDSFDPSLNEVKNEVTEEARKAKKAEEMSKKFKDALAKNKNDLNLAATSIGAMYTPLSGVSPNGAIPGLGMEPKFSGVMSGLKAGKVSEPINGAYGVYVILVSQIVPAAKSNDYSMYKNQWKSQLLGSITQSIPAAIEDVYDIKDWRYKFGSY